MFLPVAAGLATALAAWVLMGAMGPLDPLTAEMIAAVFAFSAVVSTLSLAAVSE